MNITMGKAFLFIFSGLPAVGKSTLAKFVLKEFGAVYLRIDTIEQGLKGVSPKTQLQVYPLKRIIS